MRTRVLTSSITFLIKVSLASPRLTVGLQPFISAPLNQRDKSAAEIYLMHASLGSQRERDCICEGKALSLVTSYRVSQ